MLSSRVLGILNEIVTAEKKNDLFKHELLEIHVGLLHGDLLTEFEKSREFALGMMFLCELGGVKIFVNFNIKDTNPVPIYKTKPYAEQIPKEVIEIGGMKPTKNWLRKYGMQK